MGYAALAEDNAAAFGVHWGGRLSLRFSVAYGLMSQHDDNGLICWIYQEGVTALIKELGVVLVLTFESLYVNVIKVRLFVKIAIKVILLTR